MAVAPPELIAFAREYLERALARDVEYVRRHSYVEDPSAIHAIASAPGAHLRLDELVAHLGEAPPRTALESSPRGFVHGDVAWIVDLPKVDMRHDGILDGRITMVMLRVDGEWKVTHQHLSEGVTRVL